MQPNLANVFKNYSTCRWRLLFLTIHWPFLSIPMKSARVCKRIQWKGGEAQTGLRQINGVRVIVLAWDQNKRWGEREKERGRVERNKKKLSMPKASLLCHRWYWKGISEEKDVCWKEYWRIVRGERGRVEGYSLRYLYWNYVSYNEGLHTHIA